MEILNLVGASDGEIRTPFVLEGFLQGFLGAALSLAALKLLIISLHQFSGSGGDLLFSFQLDFFSVRSQLVVLGVGAALGVAGSTMAVGRFLRA